MSISGKSAFDQNIQSIIIDSIYNNDALFILSNHTEKEMGSVQGLLSKSWEDAQKQGKKIYVKELSIINLIFPWAEHPAHALFTSAIELWKPYELETMLRHALSVQDRYAITENAYLATVLEGMSNPLSLGDRDFLSKYSFGEYLEVLRPLLQTYLLDLTSQASDRRKLGLARALTTQDRYELLRCVWHCQQGLLRDTGIQEHTRLWVYIDETENVLDYTPVERKALAKGLAHIISKTPHFLTIWFNVTEQEEETVKKVKQALNRVLQWLDFDLTS